MLDASGYYERGNVAFLDGRLEPARVAYRNALAALTLADDAWAADLYENYAITLWKLGRWNAAARAFYRVLDGNLTAREQSLRLLVSCRFRDGAPLDGERLLAIYERAFGPHPEGWKRVTDPAR
jgi:hypothetical protein